MSLKCDSLGFGLGLRLPFYQEVLSAKETVVDWWEVITENCLNLKLRPGGRPFERILKVRERYPIVMHGVSLSLGSTHDFSKDYLAGIKELYDLVEPEWVSDHLCWTGVHGRSLHDLLPLPYTKETLQHLLSRIQYVQEFLGRPLVLENVSSYLSYRASEMSEAEFLRELLLKSGAKLLLDVNNVYVSSVNHHFCAEAFIKTLPPIHIQQIHLAGHSKGESVLIDTHDAPVCAEVWDLYQKTLLHVGKPVSVMIERDANIPSLEELLKELNYARDLSRNSNAPRAAKLLKSSFDEFRGTETA